MDHPDDPALKELVLLFERGDYRAVRYGTAKLLAGDASDAVKAAARHLRARTEPSRMQLLLLGIAVVFVGVLSAYEVLRHHAMH